MEPRNQQPPEIQKRVVVFSQAAQDLIYEIQRIVAENIDLKEQLAKEQIERKAQQAMSTAENQKR